MGNAFNARRYMCLNVNNKEKFKSPVKISFYADFSELIPLHPTPHTFPLGSVWLSSSLEMWKGIQYLPVFPFPTQSAFCIFQSFTHNTQSLLGYSWRDISGIMKTLSNGRDSFCFQVLQLLIPEIKVLGLIKCAIRNKN